MSEAGRLNVLIVVDKFDYHGSYMNGPARFYSWLMERLDRRRFNPILCALRQPGRSDELFRELGVEVRYLGLGRWNAASAFSIAKQIRDCDADVLHLTGYGSTTFGRLAGLLTRTPVIVHEHWVDPELGMLHGSIERALAVLSARAIAVSEYAREFLIEKKGIPPGRIALIRNGVPLDQFTDVPIEWGSDRRAELGIGADSIVVGIVGMLHENKGHRVLMEALAGDELTGLDLVGVIIGDGELRSELEGLVRKLDIRDRVRFLGHRKDMPAMLSMLDIWVSASHSETAPLSLIEAMAAGKAIVTTDSGGPGEIIRDRSNGLQVPAGDAGELRKAIAELAVDSTLRQTLGSRAVEDSAAYDIGKMVSTLEELYVEVAGRSPPSASHPGASRP